MAAADCTPTPTLTLYSSTTTTTVITTSTLSVQTQPDGTVSTFTIPEVITTIVTILDPTSTLYATCSSTPISTIPSSLTAPQTQSTTSQPSPSPTPTTIAITSTPSPTVVTAEQTTVLDNGSVTVITYTTTSTPPPTVVVVVTSSASQSQASKSSSSNIGPIIGGAAGGFVFVVGVVVALWFILKKCRKSSDDREEEEVTFPYPVRRDRDQQRQLDLTRDSRPYEYGLVGRSTPMSTSGSSPGLVSHGPASDGRRDSVTALIGPSSGGLTPMTSTITSIQGAQTRGGDVGRETSYNSTNQLPRGAAPPSAGSGSVSGSSAAGGPSSRRPLQVINPPLSPVSMRTSYSSDVPNSGTQPFIVPESEKQSIRPENSGAILVHSDGGHIQHGDNRPSASGSEAAAPKPTTTTQPEPTNADTSEPPPAYVA